MNKMLFSLLILGYCSDVFGLEDYRVEPEDHEVKSHDQDKREERDQYNDHEREEYIKEHDNRPVDSHQKSLNQEPYNRDNKEHNAYDKKNSISVELGSDVPTVKTTSIQDLAVEARLEHQQETQRQKDELIALDKEFDFEEHNSLDSFQSSDVSGVVVTEEDRKEIKSLIADSLKGEGLSQSQIEIIDEVTNSYLEKFFKKMLRRAFKRFLKNMLKMIVKEIKTTKKVNNIMSDRDLVDLLKKTFDKQLAQEALKKKKYIQATRAKDSAQKRSSDKSKKNGSDSSAKKSKN